MMFKYDAEKKYQVIKSMTDANRLLRRGNKIYKIDEDKYKENMLIFLFYNDEKLQNDLKEISNRKYGYDYE